MALRQIPPRINQHKHYCAPGLFKVTIQIYYFHKCQSSGLPNGITPLHVTMEYQAIWGISPISSCIIQINVFTKMCLLTCQSRTTTHCGGVAPVLETIHISLWLFQPCIKTNTANTVLKMPWITYYIYYCPP